MSTNMTTIKTKTMMVSNLILGVGLTFTLPLSELVIRDYLSAPLSSFICSIYNISP